MGKKFLIFLGMMTLVYTVSGFFIAPLIIQSQIIGQIQKNFGVQAFVREVAFNPYELSLSVKGFEIQDIHHEPLGGFEEFFFNIQLISIVKGVYTFKEVRLLRPFGQLIVRPDGQLNFLDLTKQEETVPSGPETPPGASGRENQEVVSLVEPQVRLGRNPMASEREHETPVVVSLEHLSREDAPVLQDGVGVRATGRGNGPDRMRGGDGFHRVTRGRKDRPPGPLSEDQSTA